MAPLLDDGYMDGAVTELNELYHLVCVIQEYSSLEGGIRFAFLHLSWYGRKIQPKQAALVSRWFWHPGAAMFNIKYTLRGCHGRKSFEYFAWQNSKGRVEVYGDKAVHYPLLRLEIFVTNGQWFCNLITTHQY